MTHRLLVAVDGTEATGKVVDYVAAFAGQVPHLELCLATVAVGIPVDSQELAALENEVPAPELHGDEDHRRQLQNCRQLLQRTADELVRSGVREEQLTQILLPDVGGVAADLLEAAEEHTCQTLVVGRRQGAGLHHLLLGSTSKKLVEKLSGLALWVVT